LTKMAERKPRTSRFLSQTLPGQQATLVSHSQGPLKPAADNNLDVLAHSGSEDLAGIVGDRSRTETGGRPKKGDLMVVGLLDSCEGEASSASPTNLNLVQGIEVIECQPKLRLRRIP